MVCTLSTLEGKGIFIDGVELVSYIYIGGGILVLFTIPSFIYTGRYYVDFQQIISNYTAFNTSWYGEGWFLFPLFVFRCCLHGFLS